MKSRKYSLDWMLLMSAGIFFVLGKFIAPRYDTLEEAKEIFNESAPLS